MKKLNLKSFELSKANYLNVTGGYGGGTCQKTYSGGSWWKDYID